MWHLQNTFGTEGSVDVRICGGAFTTFETMAFP